LKNCNFEKKILQKSLTNQNDWIIIAKSPLESFFSGGQFYFICRAAMLLCFDIHNILVLA